MKDFRNTLHITHVMYDSMSE